MPLPSRAFYYRKCFKVRYCMEFFLKVHQNYRKSRLKTYPWLYLTMDLESYLKATFSSSRLSPNFGNIFCPIIKLLWRAVIVRIHKVLQDHTITSIGGEKNVSLYYILPISRDRIQFGQGPFYLFASTLRQDLVTVYYYSLSIKRNAPLTECPMLQKRHSKGLQWNQITWSHFDTCLAKYEFFSNESFANHQKYRVCQNNNLFQEIVN